MDPCPTFSYLICRYFLFFGGGLGATLAAEALEAGSLGAILSGALEAGSLGATLAVEALETGSLGATVAAEALGAGGLDLDEAVAGLKVVDAVRAVLGFFAVAVVIIAGFIVSGEKMNCELKIQVLARAGTIF